MNTQDIDLSMMTKRMPRRLKLGANPADKSFSAANEIE
jgi:hypothetical protein